MPPSGLEVLWEQKEFPLLLVLCVGDLNLRPFGKVFGLSVQDMLDAFKITFTWCQNRWSQSKDKVLT